jgi:hypothetical protein
LAYITQEPDAPLDLAKDGQVVPTSNGSQEIRRL